MPQQSGPSDPSNDPSKRPHQARLPRPVLRQDLRRVYQYIKAFIAQRGYPPSQRNIAQGCFMSRASVQRHLDVLVALGYLERDENTARAIVLGKTPMPDDPDDPDTPPTHPPTM